MKLTVSIFIILIICLSIVSCDKKEKNILQKTVVENYLSKKLLLPDSLKLYKPFPPYTTDADSIRISESKVKIYTHIDVSCSTCIGDIQLWEKLKNEFKEFEVPIILICESKDNFELFKHLCENSNDINSFPYPFFFNYHNNYVKKNVFMKESNHFETVLTNENNEIILMGSPIYSKEMKELYKKYIKRMILDEKPVKVVEGFLWKKNNK